ncbi:MAG: DUF3307 domain-containing protein [Methanotrichaceae archaeon]|nr:DUF3307 domain-containing protein [Methanotrichaceae archaeon]
MFLSLLAGHIIGDYFLQTEKMATKKTSSNFWAASHSLVYAVTICVTVGVFNKNIYMSSISLFVASLIVVFLSHYPIDRYRVAWRIMEFKGMPNINVPIEAAFAAIIYVIIDNSMHLAIMYWWFNGIIS